MCARSLDGGTIVIRFRGMKYYVECYDYSMGGWKFVAVAELPPERSSPLDFEQVLSTFGVFAPRGEDTLFWKDGSAVIRDASGEEIVRWSPLDRG